MGINIMKLKLLLFVSIILISCKSSQEFTGFSYDPPGVTNTTGKEITPQKLRTIGAGDPKVWITNEFESARAVDFYQVNETTFEVLIEPENHPINNSPWYAFKIWADEPIPIQLRLAYNQGRHRYLPKVYRQMGSMSATHIINNAVYDTANGSTTFGLYLETEPQTISAHFLDNSRYSELLHESRNFRQSFIEVDTVGFSNQNRAILEYTVDATDVDEAGVLVLLSRQHPPEFSGFLTYREFFKTLISDSDLAIEFRKHFVVKAFPMLNPDGVVNGHWRHNAKGVDLNRDWQNFNQPETRSVQFALTPILNDPSKRVYYGIDFHSTNENIFYPINSEIVTTPDNLSQRWFEIVKTELPELNFVSEEFDTSSPISKNWLFHTFGADALTFEVNDELMIHQIQKLGVHSANSLMRLLLEEWKAAN